VQSLMTKPCVGGGVSGEPQDPAALLPRKHFQLRFEYEAVCEFPSFAMHKIVLRIP
jgi:hypothetical protein